MRTPSVHLNGTGAEALLAQQVEAGAALRRALEALEAAAPNARDYYLQGDGAYAEAAAEHAARVGRVRSALVEVEQIAEAVADAAEGMRSCRG